MGGSACGIAVQALDILKVGRPPPLCQTERMLSSSTSVSGLHVDILESMHVMLTKLPVRQLVCRKELLHCEGLHPVTAEMFTRGPNHDNLLYRTD